MRFSSNASNGQSYLPVYTNLIMSGNVSSCSWGMEVTERGLPKNLKILEMKLLPKS